MFIRQQSTQTAPKIQCCAEKIVEKVGGGSFFGGRGRNLFALTRWWQFHVSRKSHSKYDTTAKRVIVFSTVVFLGIFSTKVQSKIRS
jgi:hypothetical protein